MKKLGIGPGDIVTYCTENRLDTYEPIFATFYLGATYNAWSHITALSNYFFHFFHQLSAFYADVITRKCFLPIVSNVYSTQIQIRFIKTFINFA